MPDRDDQGDGRGCCRRVPGQADPAAPDDPAAVGASARTRWCGTPEAALRRQIRPRVLLPRDGGDLSPPAAKPSRGGAARGRRQGPQPTRRSRLQAGCRGRAQRDREPRLARGAFAGAGLRADARSRCRPLGPSPDDGQGAGDEGPRVRRSGLRGDPQSHAGLRPTVGSRLSTVRNRPRRGPGAACSARGGPLSRRNGGRALSKGQPGLQLRLRRCSTRAGAAGSGRDVLSIIEDRPQASPGDRGARSQVSGLDSRPRGGKRGPGPPGPLAGARSTHRGGQPPAGEVGRHRLLRMVPWQRGLVQQEPRREAAPRGPLSQAGARDRFPPLRRHRSCAQDRLRRASPARRGG